MANFFLKQLRRLSLAFLLIVFFICYVQLPDAIAFEHNRAGQPVGFVDKQHFFYLSALIILLLLVLFGVLRSQLIRLDISRIFPNSAWATNPEQLNGLMVGWSDAFWAAINFYLGFTFLGLKSVNQTLDQSLDRNYDWFLLIGAFVLLFFIFFVPIRLLFTKPSH